MYPELMVIPMREDLKRMGIDELKTASDVDRELGIKEGTTLVVVNSICGCAAGRMRPAVRAALQHPSKPSRAFSVFAGQDVEATERARSYFAGYPPSSPSLALFREGELVHMMQRSDIEHRDSMDLAAELKRVFDQHCAPAPK